MTLRLADQITVLALDIFGTTVDWRTGVADQVGRIAADRGVALDGAAFADAWRDRYMPSMARVRAGERAWVNLDVLHRESLDDVLAAEGIGDAFDEATRHRMVLAWHQLPPWEDVLAGLTRLRTRYVLAAVSNGGFALLTHLVKSAGLPVDCILSAELARSYKPDPQVYRTAAALLDCAPDQVLMVAAHGWDIDGARSAGLRTAFLERPTEKGPLCAADRAADFVNDLTVENFVQLADALSC